MVKRLGFPEINELVIAKVKEVSQFAAWCDLEEYPHLKGLINISEAIGKWIYNINEVVKVDQTVVAKVIKVEENENLVHLSLKRVSENEEKEKMNEFRKEQTAEKILENAAKKLGKTLDQAYEEVGYYLQKKFGYLFLAFEEILDNRKALKKLKISEEWENAIMSTLEERFGKREFKIKYEIVVKSLSKDGIKKVKEILLDLEKNGKREVKYISAPRYLFISITDNPKEEEKELEELLKKVKQKALKNNVEFDFKRID